MNNNVIPPMTDPLSKHWDQPPREHILIDDKHAVMTRWTFNMPKEYSRSVPSGVYPGKMWKACFQDDTAQLRWFGIIEDRPEVCSINCREILIVDKPAESEVVR